MKKGLTLVELLSVIIIIFIVLSLSVIYINRNVLHSKERVSLDQIRRVEELGKKWYLQYGDEINYEEEEYFLDINELRKSGLTDVVDIVNPNTGDIMQGCIKISLEENYNQPFFNYQEDC